MNKQIQQYQNLLKRGKMIVFLFCLNFFFVFLAMISFLFRPINANLPLFFMFLSVVDFIYTALKIRKVVNWIRELTDFYMNNNYGTTMQRIEQFNELLDENQFEYHFQPIINAKTGEIFGYEALMRTDLRFDMLPLEILDLAAKQNRLYDIEKYTFINTLKIMKENYDTFKSKKLFINSISSHQLKDSDFDQLYKEYDSLFENLVLEITEATLLNDAGIKTIQQRLRESNCQLALDDYGTGYSNESNLLKTNPHYVKIDRSLLRYINIDSKKQHLVSNLVGFALQNNIKIIAEGIETYEEFEYVINLGVDYIQGFYTAKPTPVLIPNIPSEFVVAIQDLNRKRNLETMSKRIFETSEEKVLSLVSLALDQYSDIVINSKSITLQGNGMIANLSILIPDHMKCTVTLDNVNILGDNTPSVILGSNSHVILHLVGDNSISYGGIRVPETSDLTIAGDGNLTVKSDRTSGVGIGGTLAQTFGNITLATTGIINVINSGDMSIGIGGAYNTANSLLHLVSGTILVETSGHQSLGIGSAYGNARIKIDHCMLTIVSQATKSVGVGCLKGAVDIETSGELNIKCEGKNAIGIGVLEEGTGSITIQGGAVNLHNNVHDGAGIGAIGGAVDIHIQNGNIRVYSEGTNIVGIGDHFGTGAITIHNGLIFTELYAAFPIPIGNNNNIVIINGGNIQCDFTKDIKLVNSYGAPLTARLIQTTHPYKKVVETSEYSYTYEADYCELYPNIKVYLPEGIDE